MKMKRRIEVLFLTLFLMIGSIVSFLPEKAYAAELNGVTYDYVLENVGYNLSDATSSGTEKGLNYYIFDDQHTLILTGTQTGDIDIQKEIFFKDLGIKNIILDFTCAAEKYNAGYKLYFGPITVDNIVDAPNFSFGDRKDLSLLFYNTYAKKIVLDNADTSNITIMDSIFQNAVVDYVDITKWNTENVESYIHTFSNCKINNIDLSNLSNKSAKRLQGAFLYAGIPVINLSNFKEFPDNGYAETVSMFSGCTANKIIIPNIIGKIHMQEIFYGCRAKELDLNNWNVETDCGLNFIMDCPNLETIKADNANLNFMAYQQMFSNLPKLEELRLPNSQSVIKNGSKFISNCEKLKVIDISSMTADPTCNNYAVFCDLPNLETIYAQEWEGESQAPTFQNCPKLKGNIKYSDDKQTKAYANYEGYFTPKTFEFKKSPDIHQSDKISSMIYFNNDIKNDLLYSFDGINFTENDLEFAKAGEQTVYIKSQNIPVKSKTVTVSPHKFVSNYITETEPSCEKSGQKYRICIECNKKEYQSIPAKGHVYSLKKKVKPTCTEKGYDLYTCSNNPIHEEKKNYVNPTGHEYSPSKYEEDDKYIIETKECKECGYISTIKKEKPDLPIINPNKPDRPDNPIPNKPNPVKPGQNKPHPESFNKSPVTKDNTNPDIKKDTPKQLETSYNKIIIFVTLLILFIIIIVTIIYYKLKNKNKSS